MRDGNQGNRTFERLPDKATARYFHFIHVLRPLCTASQASTARLALLRAPSTQAARPPSASQLPPHAPVIAPCDPFLSPSRPGKLTPTESVADNSPKLRRTFDGATCVDTVPSPYRPFWRCRQQTANSKLLLATRPCGSRLRDTVQA